MPNWKKVIVSGSDAALNTLTVSNGITGSLQGTASYASNANSSSYALSASYALNTTSASYALNSTSASYALSASNAATASYVLNAVSSSFASTASSVDTLNQNVIISGSLTIVTGSGIELQVLNTGVRIGNVIGDAHSITGSLGISGSVIITGSSFSIVSTAGATNTEFQVLSTGTRIGNATGDTHNVTGSLRISGSNIIRALTNAATPFQINSPANVSIVRINGIGGVEIGADSSASGTGSFAQGDSFVTALGDYSHAQGNSTNAVGMGSHAEGASTVSTGDFSHAEGTSTNAIGTYSHAEGSSTRAVGDYSHAEGEGTIASGSAQTVMGKYNTQNNTTSLVIIGNGVDDGTRSDLALFNTNQIVFNAPLSGSSFTGSLLGTASWASNAVTASYVLNAVSSSFATTASYVLNAVSSSFATTASYVLNAVSSSFATTASYVLNAVSSSFALTASFVNPLNQNVVITGSLTVFTGSGVELQVTNTGVNIGNVSTDNHNITGATRVTGSLTVTGSVVLGGPAPFQNSVYIQSNYGVSFADIGNANVAIGASGVLYFGGVFLTPSSIRASTSGNMVLASDSTAITGSGKLHIRGAGATSATNALYVENSANTNILTLKNNGSMIVWPAGGDEFAVRPPAFVSDNTMGFIFKPGPNYGNDDTFLFGGSRYGIFAQNNSNVNSLRWATGYGYQITQDLVGIYGNIPFWQMNFFSQYAMAPTSGDTSQLNSNISFAPSAGSASFAVFSFRPTINQTGTATGISRGLYIAPTLTSASSFRAIEWTNNSNSFGLYGSGSAANVLRGNTTIGTLTTGSATFNVSGSSDFKGNVTTTGSLNVSSNSLTVNIDSTNNNWVGVNTATSASYIKNFPLVVKGNNASDAYATIALVNDQPLIKWKGTYNSSNGAELYQNGSGTFLLNTNSSISGFAIYSDGSPAFALYASTKMVVGDTVTPASALGKLHIRGGGATSATNALYVQNSSGTQALTVRDDGLIRIGETATDLQITPSLSRIIFANPNSNGLIGFSSYNTFLTPTGLRLFSRSTIDGGVNTLGDFRFYNVTTAKTYMYITETGKISINKGTVTPNADLDVSGSVIITGSLTVITGSAVELQVLNTGVNIGNVVGDTHTVTGSLGVSGSSNFRGNIIITGSANNSLRVRGSGTTSATTALYIENSSAAKSFQVADNGKLFLRDITDESGEYGLYWFNTGTSYGIYKTTGSWSAPNYTQLKVDFPTGIIIDGGDAYGKSGTVIQPSSGNVGIGTSSPSAKLHVDGTVRIDNQNSSTPTGPNASAGTVTNYWGTADGTFLSTPSTWLKINLGGTDYYLPAYQ